MFNKLRKLEFLHILISKTKQNLPKKDKTMFNTPKQTSL